MREMASGAIHAWPFALRATQAALCGMGLLPFIADTKLVGIARRSLKVFLREVSKGQKSGEDALYPEYRSRSCKGRLPSFAVAVSYAFDKNPPFFLSRQICRGQRKPFPVKLNWGVTSVNFTGRRFTMEKKTRQKKSRRRSP